MNVSRLICPAYHEHWVPEVPNILGSRGMTALARCETVRSCGRGIITQWIYLCNLQAITRVQLSTPSEIVLWANCRETHYSAAEVEGSETI